MPYYNAHQPFQYSAETKALFFTSWVYYLAFEAMTSLTSDPHPQPYLLGPYLGSSWASPLFSSSSSAIAFHRPLNSGLTSQADPSPASPPLAPRWCPGALRNLPFKGGDFPQRMISFWSHNQEVYDIPFEEWYLLPWHQNQPTLKSKTVAKKIIRVWGETASPEVC